MRTSHILLLCILGLSLLSSVVCNSGIGPDRCCLGFYDRKLNKRQVRSYYMTDHRCPKTGAVLVTKKSRQICVDPKRPWVKKIMTSVDRSNF